MHRRSWQPSTLRSAPDEDCRGTHTRGSEPSQRGGHAVSRPHRAAGRDLHGIRLARLRHLGPANGGSNGGSRGTCRTRPAGGYRFHADPTGQSISRRMGVRRVRLCSHSTAVALVPTGTRPTGVDRGWSVGLGRFRSSPSLGEWSCRSRSRGGLQVMSKGSVQVRLDLTAIRDSVACFG